MNLTQLKLILKQPLPIILKKVRTIIYEKITHKWLSYKYKTNDYRNSSSSPTIILNKGLVDLNKIQTAYINTNVQDYLIKMYTSHRFDLLGSGWVKNSYHSTPVGIEGILFESGTENIKHDENGEWLNRILNKNHVVFSREIWKEILSTNANYIPIDWQKDYKCGFRFNAKLPYIKQTKLVHSKGIDLKMPWELSRLQHLPQLAIFAKNNTEKQIDIIKEFRCQLLDFIMTNPIGMGVNWSCTMDVGIRAANIALALDWFIQLDTENILDNWFKNIVTNYLFQHGNHIFNNFEYKEGLTSNHYLGNIAGLTFISSYLVGNKQLDFWLAYAIQELKNELPKQFFKDGSNFEGSTSYHRLSGEMFIYSFTIINAISEDRLQSISILPSKKYFTKAAYKKTTLNSSILITPQIAEYFYKMGEFSQAYRKPNGNISQVGDNDSGRFFKFTPCGEFISLNQAFDSYVNYKKTDEYTENNFWNENHINHDSFIAAINGLFNDSTKLDYSNNYKVEFQIVQNLVQPFTQPNFSSDIVTNETNVIDLAFRQFFSKDIKINSQSLQLNCFPDFGFISITNEIFYFSISFGANHQSHHSWGHQHNDKLAIEIQYNGKDILIDPGTYIYTPLPEKRNLFRSTFMHNTISIDNREQNSLVNARGGLFNVAKDTTTKIRKATSTHLIIQANYFDVKHIREVVISEEGIQIIDYCNHNFKQNFSSQPFSDGYGKLMVSSVKHPSHQ